MTPLRDADWDALEWAGAAGTAWELHAGEALVARLRFIAPATLTAEAEATEGQWRLTLTGMMLRKLTVREAAAPSGPPLLQTRPTLRHTWVLPQADGQVLRWQRADLASPDWICVDQDHRPLIILEVSAGHMHHARSEIAMTARFLLQEAARSVAGLSLAVVIGWLLLVAYSMASAL
jgi:hypothetical protein